MNTSDTAVRILCQSRMEFGQELAEALDIPYFLQEPPANFRAYLDVTDTRLELRLGSQSTQKSGSIFCEFATGTLDYRRRYSKGKQMILKAVGGSGRRVIDLTAGLGRDAFILASGGCFVTAVERSPIIFSLLKDGIQRGKLHPGLSEILVERITMVNGEALEVLTHGINGESGWDVAYLDPMFPSKTKSALPKKEMVILQEILEPTGSAEVAKLIEAARKVCKRVVVKRPSHSLAIVKPSHSLSGESTRFDIYL